MSTPYPIIRFQSDERTYRLRAFYDGPSDQGNETAITLDDPSFATVADDGGLEPFPMLQAAVAAGSIFLQPAGGTPTLKGTADGHGGLLYANYTDFVFRGNSTYTLDDQPVGVPAGASNGDLLLMCLLFLDLDKIFRQDAPYVPPGWNLVAFDICDVGFMGKGLAMGIYSRTFGPDTPTTFNPFEEDIEVSDPWGFTTPEWVHLEGNWLAQLRVYSHAAVGAHQTAVMAQARLGDGSSIVKTWPTLGDPLDLTSPGGLQAQFFCTQYQGGYKIDLAPGGSNKLLSGKEVQTLGEVFHDASGFFDQLLGLSNGPLLRIASEDLSPGFAGGNLTWSNGPIPPPGIGDGSTTTLRLTVRGGSRDLHATATVKLSTIPSPHYYVTGVTADTAVVTERGFAAFLYRELEEIGPFSVGTKLRHDGECDRGAEPELGIPLAFCKAPTPRKFGPPGILTRPGVNWTQIAHGPNSTADFQSQSQIVHGASVAGPAMQMKNGVLTSADPLQVALLFDQYNGWFYRGEKYALKWLTPGPVGDGTKLRLKACTMSGRRPGMNAGGQFVSPSPGGNVPPGQPTVGADPGAGAFGSWAVVINMIDRQTGLAFFANGGIGWLDDLRALGTNQWYANQDVLGNQGPDTAAGQNPLKVLAAEQAENEPFGAEGQAVTNVVWIEVWRDGNTVRAAIWESDPLAGEAPIWTSAFDVTGNPRYGPGVSGYWGVIAGTYMDPNYSSYSGVTMGFAELSLFQAS